MRAPLTALCLTLATATTPASDHWAFGPLAPPAADTASIDTLVAEKLTAAGLPANPRTGDATLLRRLHFALVGLPPTPEQTDAFLADTAADKLARVTDQLLASRGFAERFGRHWLDLARYADSNGLDENFLFREAWRYRNNVIDAVHADTPLDRFILEQIAGDLLSYDTTDQRDRQRIAAGFLALGPKVLLGNKPANQDMEVADELLETVGKTFLGLSLGCARCHDHKFDPVPARDYYAMAGIFTSTTVMETRHMLGQQRRMEQLVGLGDGGEGVDDAYETYWRGRGGLQKKIGETKAALTKPHDSTETPAADHYQQLSAELTDLQHRFDHPPGIPPRAMAPRDKDSPSAEPVRRAGAFDQPVGDPVPRGFIQVLQRGAPPQLPENASGRVELARWLTDTENGAGHLTARVLANRVWHHLIGRGIVRTTDNFGTTGEPPTHPQLLDHLAARLVDSGWSLKSLVRDIVLTDTFARASTHDGAADAADPDNTLLWRGHRRRLDPESIRDAMLAVSGLLDRSPVDSTVNYLGDQATAVGKNENRRKTDFRCRSVYLPVIRNDLPEVFEAFDFADPHATTGARPRTAVPSQSLFLLNDPSVLDAADALAKRLQDDPALPDDETRIDKLFHLLFNTPPTTQERDDLLTFLHSHNPKDAAWPAAAHALLTTTRFQFLD